LVFCFGFEKSNQSNLADWEEKLLQQLSDMYQNTTEEELLSDIKDGDLIQISKTEG
jgi:hypothetical protein